MPKALAELLGKGDTTMSLVKDAVRPPLEVKSEDEEKNVEFLETRYNKAQDEIRRMDAHLRDVEESFAELSGILAAPGAT